MKRREELNTQYSILITLLNRAVTLTINTLFTV